jgi:hypothetical protein
MAVKTQKSVQPETTTEIDLETALAKKLAEQIDSEIDYSKLAKMTIVHLVVKAKTRFMTWLTSGDNIPIDISPFPDLTALHSSEATHD